jgi:hypothetical protein
MLFLYHWDGKFEKKFGHVNASLFVFLDNFSIFCFLYTNIHIIFLPQVLANEFRKLIAYWLMSSDLNEIDVETITNQEDVS